MVRSKIPSRQFKTSINELVLEPIMHHISVARRKNFSLSRVFQTVSPSSSTAGQIPPLPSFSGSPLTLIWVRGLPLYSVVKFLSLGLLVEVWSLLSGRRSSPSCGVLSGANLI
uniref:Uncharacterized protein n=1 Tax=Arundo donax TaxID=35708 RepID=A0A0A8XPB0_ARUDO